MALEVAPGSAEYVPALQLVQEGEEGAAKDPAKHCLHIALLFAASPGLAVPAGQLVQPVDCVRPSESPYVPEGHGTLGAEPPVQKYPKGHTCPWALLEAVPHALPGAAVQLRHSEEAFAPVKLV